METHPTETNQIETNLIAYCEECGSKITTDDNVAYVDQDGHYFDTIECVLEYFGITKREL